MVVALILTLCGAGCSPAARDTAPVAPTPEVMTESQFRAAAESVVAEREAALLAGDRDGFLATIDDDELQFAATQQRWFNNLAQMPLTDLSLAVSDAAVPGVEASDLKVPVDFTMRLDGFEDKAVTQRLVYTFTRTANGLLLVADRDARTDKEGGWLPEPWDIAHVVVRQSASVLAFFDEETSPYADAVMKDLEASRLTVLAALPEWSGTLVAYDISDLTGLEKRSPMSLAETAGIAYPIYARPGSRQVAAYRFVVNPQAAHNGLEREFLLRHELTHIALADRDDRSPVWLVEGAAGYVEGSHLPPEQQRYMSAYAVSALGAQVPVLGNGRDFYQNAEAQYPLAAAACSYLVATRGPDVLWDLMDAFTQASNLSDSGGSLTGQQVDELLVREIGLDTAGLTLATIRWAGSPN